MVLCRPQRVEGSEVKAQADLFMVGGPIFLPQRKLSPFAQQLLDELSSDGEHAALEAEELPQ